MQHGASNRFEHIFLPSLHFMTNLRAPGCTVPRTPRLIHLPKRAVECAHSIDWLPLMRLAFELGRFVRRPHVSTSGDGEEFERFSAVPDGV